MEPYLKKVSYKRIKNQTTDTSVGFLLADGNAIENVWLRTSKCVNNPKAKCGDFYLRTQGVSRTNENKKYIFGFDIYQDAIKPMGNSEDTFQKCLNGEKLAFCTAWVITNGNMDYLHCDNLSWQGKHKCK